MRKKHQSLLITSHAKKNICNEISLNMTSYEVEQKQILNSYFKENINPEDIEPKIIFKKEKAEENVEEEEEENEDLEDISNDEEEDIISLNSNIKVPPLGEQKGPYIKYEISEKGYVGGINYDDYTIIPNNKIKIKEEENENNDKKRYKNYKNNEKKEGEEKQERLLDVGKKINFSNILEQIAYWTEEINNEKCKDKGKNKRKIKEIEIPDINILHLFKLYPNKTDEILEKIKILQKEARDKNVYGDNCIIKRILDEQENIVNEKKQNINKLSKEFEKLKSITYGNNFSLIEFK